MSDTTDTIQITDLNCEGDSFFVRFSDDTSFEFRIEDGKPELSIYVDPDTHMIGLYHGGLMEGIPSENETGIYLVVNGDEVIDFRDPLEPDGYIEDDWR